jgi:hypothetical protein
VTMAMMMVAWVTGSVLTSMTNFIAVETKQGPYERGRRECISAERQFLRARYEGLAAKGRECRNN